MRKKIYQIAKWEIFACVICLIILISIVIMDFFPCPFNKTHPLFFSTLINLSTGIITAIAILFFQRIHRKRNLFTYYSQIAGSYIRTDIGQDNTRGENMVKLREQNIGLKITVMYKDENTFTYDMELWKDDNAKAKGILEFNENNKIVARGNYKYYQGSDYLKNHFGTLTAFWFKDDKKKLYVLYQHVYPRQIDLNNPDDNRGWQIWEKTE